MHQDTSTIINICCVEGKMLRLHIAQLVCIHYEPSSPHEHCGYFISGNPSAPASVFLFLFLKNNKVVKPIITRTAIIGHNPSIEETNQPTIAILLFTTERSSQK